MHPIGKILIVIDNLYGGGAQRVACRLANSLIEKNYEVVFLCFSDKGTYRLDDRISRFYFQEPTYRQHRLGRVGNYYFAILRRLNLIGQVHSLKRSEHPDVTLSMLKDPNLLNAFSGVRRSRKVMSERNNPRRLGKGYWFSGLLSYIMSDKVVFQSHTVKNMYPKLIRRKGVVVPNPVSVECCALGGSNRIVTMGRLKPQKNHKLLIEAFAIFSKSHPMHTLHIYGRGYDTDEVGYNELIERHSLKGKVFLEGHQEHIHEKIADAEQFVMSSDFEGVPNALLEAMMMGLPCTSTAFEGTDEIFGNEEVCQLVPLGAPSALAAAMSRVADDSCYRKDLASRGKEFVKMFSTEVVVKQWIEALFG